jgi:hypothetical protein
MNLNFSYSKFLSCLFITILFIISCKPKPIASRPAVITIYDANFEILNGKVKQLTETSATSYSGVETTVTDFDLRGNATQKINKNDAEDSWKYVYKYDRSGKKTGMIAHGGGMHPEFHQLRYQYDKAGRVAIMALYTKELKDDSDSALKEKKFYYKYNNVGDLVQTDGYYEKDHQFTQTYKYDRRHFLIGTTDDNRIYYKYPLIDKKGNWLKKISVRYDDEEPVASDTVTRTITYYH